MHTVHAYIHISTKPSIYMIIFIEKCLFFTEKGKHSNSFTDLYIFIQKKKEKENENINELSNLNK